MTEWKRGQGNDWPLAALFLIHTHNKSRKNNIGYEIDGSVRSEKRTRIKLIAIEIIRMMSDDLGTMAG
jgi:hypothetical protein